MRSARFVRLVRPRQVVHPRDEVVACEVSLLDVCAFARIHLVRGDIGLAFGAARDVVNGVELLEKTQWQMPDLRIIEEALFLELQHELEFRLRAGFIEPHLISRMIVLQTDQIFVANVTDRDLRYVRAK